VKFFDAYPRADDPAILETGGGDGFGERLGEIDVPSGDQGTNAKGDRFVIDHPIEAVFERQGVFDGQIHIDADGLVLRAFVAMDSDLRQQLEISNENMSENGTAVSSARK
jgi:hypothetical protein